MLYLLILVYDKEMDMMYYGIYESFLGNITLVADSDNLMGLWIEGQKYFLRNVKGDLIRKEDLSVLVQTKAWLYCYFAKERPNIKELPLAPQGSLFQQTIWNLLCEIPYGTLITYKALAQKAAIMLNKTTMSAQAVGGAVGHNPISIIIPCHRVVGSNGSLTGYAGGMDKKISLLELEEVDMSNLFIPKNDVYNKKSRGISSK